MTDRQTDRQTQGEKQCFPTLAGGRHNGRNKYVSIEGQGHFLPLFSHAPHICCLSDLQHRFFATMTSVPAKSFYGRAFFSTKWNLKTGEVPRKGENLFVTPGQQTSLREIPFFDVAEF